MELTATEGRVLGCLVERQVAVPDDATVTLDELRFSCNRTSGRDPVVAFDDRVVEDALLSLKSKGLARFVSTGRSGGPALYRHRADDRWRLDRYELAALAVLLLRGPLTTDQVRTAVAGQSSTELAAQIEAALDTLAGRTPTPLATRVTGGGEVRWVEVLTDRFVGRTDDSAPTLPGMPARPRSQDARWSPEAERIVDGRPAPTLTDLADRLTNIERRLAGIEAALGALRAANRPADVRR